MFPIEVDEKESAPGAGGGPYYELPVRYAAVRQADLLVSHKRVGRDAMAGEDAYPKRVQHREYGGPREADARAAVERAAGRLDPGQLLDLTATVAGGPPVVVADPRVEAGASPRYVCVVGNQRCLSLDWALERFPLRWAAYAHALAHRAALYGLGAAEREWIGGAAAAVAALRDAGAASDALRAAAPVLVRVLDASSLGRRGDL